MADVVKRIDTSRVPKLTFFPETAEDDLVQRIYCLLSTVKGTVPCYRDFGLSSEWLHRPINAVQSLYATQVAQALAAYLPDVKLLRIRFDNDPARPDYLHPILEVKITT